LGHNREVYEEGFNELSELLEVVVIELLVLALFCIATTGIFQKKKMQMVDYYFLKPSSITFLFLVNKNKITKM
jgi:hypothetical protein